ncbi:MAG: serine protease [Actinobacteria bacterium]|nr:serine protease [Actinomycetota bacterium]
MLDRARRLRRDERARRQRRYELPRRHGDGALRGCPRCRRSLRGPLAVLRVPGARFPKALPLRKQSSLRHGETVVALGYPANASGLVTLTSTTGVVSVTRSAYREPSLDIPSYSNVIQTVAAINPGHSGGLVIDLRGRLVGVNTVRRMVSGDRIIQGENYAIGSDRVREVTEALRRGRSFAQATRGALAAGGDTDARRRPGHGCSKGGSRPRAADPRCHRRAGARQLGPELLRRGRRDAQRQTAKFSMQASRSSPVRTIAVVME